MLHIEKSGVPGDEATNSPCKEEQYSHSSVTKVMHYEIMYINSDYNYYFFLDSSVFSVFPTDEHCVGGVLGR